MEILCIAKRRIFEKTLLEITLIEESFPLVCKSYIYKRKLIGENLPIAGVGYLAGLAGVAHEALIINGMWSSGPFCAPSVVYNFLS